MTIKQTGLTTLFFVFWALIKISINIMSILFMSYFIRRNFLAVINWYDDVICAVVVRKHLVSRQLIHEFLCIVIQGPYLKEVTIILGKMVKTFDCFENDWFSFLRTITCVNCMDLNNIIPQSSNLGLICGVIVLQLRNLGSKKA